MDITSEVVNKALREIIADYPDCNSNGLTSASCTEQGALEAFADNGKFLREVKFCYEYIEDVISRIGVCKTINRGRHTSYSLKHIVECYISNNYESENSYVCNFALIAAMQLHPKAKFKVIDNSCNPYVNIRFDPKY